MPGSKDTFHKDHPETNAWLRHEQASARQMSGQIERLARRMGKDPADLAGTMSPDTVRRTKFPVVETVDAEGRRIFKHDPGIVDDGRTGLVRR